MPSDVCAAGRGACYHNVVCRQEGLCLRIASSGSGCDVKGQMQAESQAGGYQGPWPRAGSRPRTATVVGVAALALAACSPTFDWREAEAAGDLGLLFPCQPRRNERRLLLAGQRVTMQLQACEAGGVIWGLAAAETGAPQQVPAALEALNRATGANAAAEVARIGPAAVPGATPQAAAQRVSAVGRRPDGSAVQIEAWSFARGTRVYQASAVRTAAPSPAQQEAQDQFFGSLRFVVIAR